MKLNHPLFRDPEFYFLILYNLFLVYLFLYSDYDARYTIWGYFLQSVFIGFQLVVISITKIYKKDRSFLPFGKFSLILFFIAHFGLFHFVYLIFLVIMLSNNDSGEQILNFVEFIKISIGYLLANSIFMIGREWMPSAPDYPKPSIAAAYVRIVPIHLFIILNTFAGGINPIAFAVFMLLKLLGDLFIYIMFSSNTSPKREQ